MAVDESMFANVLHVPSLIMVKPPEAEWDSKLDNIYTVTKSSKSLPLPDCGWKKAC